MSEKKKLAIKKESIVILLGVIIALIAAIVILSSSIGKPFNFIANITVQAIGFVGFWVLFPLIFIYGVFLTFKGKIPKFKFNLTFLGLFIVVSGLLVLATFYATHNNIDPNQFEDATDLAFNNFVQVFKYYFQEASTEFSVTYEPMLSGGYVGFFLVALFNQGFTIYGTQVVGWLIVLVGILVTLNTPIRNLFIKLKEKRKNNKAAKKAPKVSEAESSDYRLLEEENNSFVHPDIALNRNETYREEETPYLQTETVYKEEEKPYVEEVHEVPLEETNDNDLGLTRDYAEVLEKKSLSDLKIKSYNRTHGLVKAHYQFSGTTSEPLPHVENIEKQYEKPSVSESVYEEEVSNDFNNTVTQTTNNYQNEVKEEPIIPIVQETISSNVPVNPVNKVAEPSNVSTNNSVRNESVNENNKKDEEPTIESSEDAERYLANYVCPATDLLKYHANDNDGSVNEETTAERTRIIDETFANFKIGAHVAGHTVGPSVTRFDIALDPTTTVSNVQKVINDLAIRLGGVLVRFEPLVLSKTTSGLEVQNIVRTTVGLREALEGLPEKALKHKLEIPFGKDISGELIHADLAKMPHLLIAGTTGSGKSIFMRSLITTLIIKNRPDELRLVLIDPKTVEMACYQRIPHLLCPTITDAKKVKVALDKLVDEMERRYNLFATNYCDSISSYNEKAKAEGLKPLPRIVVCVDEYADLMQSCKEVEVPVLRIAQKARAAGIHLVIATQRPTVDIINGTIKANFSTHVALMVSSVQDSQVIIGEKGAEQLLGDGDMLIESPLISRTSKIRVQGTFIEMSEILNVCNFIKKQMPSNYDKDFLDLNEHSSSLSAVDETPSSLDISDKELQEEELYDLIKEDVMKRDTCSISFIQRTYGVGFPKAGRLFAKLQKEGIVSLTPTSSARGCEVLIHSSNDDYQNLGSIEQSTIIRNDDEVSDSDLNEDEIDEAMSDSELINDN